MPKQKQKKPWVKVDQQLYVIRQSDVYTAAKVRQIYKIRIVKWGQFQAVLQKRLFVFNEQLMDYVPGRLMGFNMNDMQAIYRDKDKIMEILGQSFENLRQGLSYKQKVIEMNKRNNEMQKGIKK